MKNPPSQREFDAAFIRRVKELRVGSGMTQQEMATLLHTPYENYKKYETRSPLPHYLIEPFALAVRRDIAYVLTGRPSKQPETAARPRPRRVA